MRAVAIINMPNCCHNCVFGDWDQCLCKLANEEFYSQENMDGRQKWCPLKPLQQKQELIRGRMTDGEEILEAYIYGYNACIEELEDDCS